MHLYNVRIVGKIRDFGGRCQPFSSRNSLLQNGKVFFFPFWWQDQKITELTVVCCLSVSEKEEHFCLGEYSQGVVNVEPTHHLAPKYRAVLFPNDFCVSADMLDCKYIWCRLETCEYHLRSKACVKNEEKTLFPTLSNGEISIKGKNKQNSREIKTK